MTASPLTHFCHCCIHWEPNSSMSTSSAEAAARTSRGFRISPGLLALGQSLQVLGPVLVRTKRRDLEIRDEVRHAELPEREVENRLVERVAGLQVEHGVDVRGPRGLPDRLDGARAVRLERGLGLLFPSAVEFFVRRARRLFQMGL